MNSSELLKKETKTWGMLDTLLNRSIIEICENLIYHGRHFNKNRDKIVIEKSLCRTRELFEHVAKFWISPRGH